MSVCLTRDVRGAGVTARPSVGEGVRTARSWWPQHVATRLIVAAPGRGNIVPRPLRHHHHAAPAPAAVAAAGASQEVSRSAMIQRISPLSSQACEHPPPPRALPRHRRK